MSCRINYKANPVSEIRDMVEKKKYSIETFFDQTQEETATKFLMYKNIVTTELVDNSQLGSGYHLDPSGKTMRYVWIDTKNLAFKNRVTDKSKINFAKKKGKLIADALSNTEDSIHKRELGTSLHKFVESIMNYYLHTIDSEFIEKSEKYIGKEKADLAKIVTEDKYLKSYFLTDNKFNSKFTEFTLGIKEVLLEAIEIQKIKDPKGKFIIFTEQFLPSFKRNLGGTADLLILYSDNTVDLYDYKSVHIDDPSNLDPDGNINNTNWLPEYKLEDFNTQIPQLVNILLEEGIKKVNRARVIPIQAQLLHKQLKDRKEGSKLTGVPKLIKISTKANEYLTQIPLIAEDTGNKILNTSIEESYLLLNNLTSRLEKLEVGSVKYNVLKKRISTLQKAISDLIIKKEFTNLTEAYKTLVNKFINVNKVLTDIDNKKITVNGNEAINYNYLNLEQILDLIDDVKVFLSISSSLPSYLNDLSITDKNETNQNLINNLKDFDSRALTMLNILKDKVLQRSLTDKEQAQLEDDRELGAWDKLMSRFSEIPNTVIQKARKLIETANNKSRIEFQKFEQSLKKISGNLDQWGDSQGLNHFEVYKYLINTDTWDLHPELTKEVYERLERAKESKNDAEIDKIYSLKPNAQKLFDNYKENYKIKNNITDETSPEFIKWLKFNDPKILKYTNKAYKYYEIDRSKLKETDYTKEFLFIKSHKPLLDYYNFWIDSMGKFRDMYDFRNSYQKIPNNFIPWIQKSMLESYYTNGIFNNNNINEIIKNHLSIKQEEKEINYSDNYVTIKGQIDPDTGKAKREIPKLFVNPLRNASGEIDGSLKSFDLNASLLTFAYGAINYNNMKEIEITIDALKDVLAMKGVKQVDHSNNIIKYAYNKLDATLFGESVPELALFDKMIDYHMYGIRIQETGKTAQFLLKAKRYQQLKELALSPLSAASNLIGARTNALFEGKKGYYYTKSMYNKATKDRFNLDEQVRNKYFAVANFFQPYQGKPVEDVAKKYKGNKFLKNLNLNSMFAAFRNGDEHIEEQVLYSIMQNYGIQNGKIVRIGNKENIKSLLDNTSIEGDNLIIQDIIDKDGNVNTELYSDFRQLVLNIIAAQKGSMNDEDMNTVNMHLASNLMMSFKNWMPGLINERFKGALDSNSLRYNNSTNTVTQARYASLISELELNTEDTKLTNFLFKVFQPTMIKFFTQVATFNLYKYKINEDRAKTEFLDFKHKHRNNAKIQEYDFKDFLDYKQGQINALATELRAILIVMGFLALMGGDWDDDDEKDYKSSWIGRQSYRLLNRYRRELVSLINPDDWKGSIFKNIIPISALGFDMQTWLKNTFDETRDVVFGENSKKDKTPAFYYTYRFIPGYKLPMVVLEPFEQAKKAEY